MRLQNILQPRTILSRDEVRRGLRALTWEGMASTGFSSITASTFLVAFTLALGANNFQIGVLASIPFITDLLQIPAVWLIERLRKRKVIVILTWLISQLLWIPIALIPIFMDIPGTGAISILLGVMAVRGILNALTNCGWSSWKRDLVPQSILGRYLARRLSLSTAVAIIIGLSAGYFLDYWQGGESGAIGYSVVLLIGLFFFGLVSPALMTFIPEPMMPPVVKSRLSFSQTISAPLKETNFRHFMKFLMFWGFASNMAIPFFAVFLLQQLELSIFTVIALTMVSEVFTIVALRFWGHLADRFGSKIVLYLSTLLFLIVLAGWAFNIIPGQHTLMIPLLVILHVFVGIAVGGINLTTETLSFKLAPHGKSTSYLTSASLAESAGIGLGALAGGFLADLLTERTLVINISSTSPFQSINLDYIQFTGYHLHFAIALIVGLITLRTIKPVIEKGATRKEAILPVLAADISALFSQVYRTLDLTCFNISARFNCSRLVLASHDVFNIGINQFGNERRKAAYIVPTARSFIDTEPPS
jgi:MFS family permease